MPTLNKTPWHPLPLTTPIRGAPPLLLQSTFTSSTYTIHLTDLVHIWSVTATKPSILALAETFQSPIDPSETSQLTILLTKLESALSAASAHTDITLTSTSAGDLQIHTSTELPRPLKELKWVFTLTRLPDAEFTNLFLLPVLSVVSTLADQVESLVRVVRDKDGIIERLTDQVAEQGLDVKNLLGGGRARRRGLERFEVEAWRDEYIKEGEKRVGEVVKEVFGEGVRCGEAPGVRGLGMVEGWWKAIEEEEGKPKIEKRESSERVERVDDGIRSLTRVISPRRTASPKRASYGGMAPSKRFRLKDSDDEDDDFEVQKTPPPKPYHPFTLKKPSPPPKSVAPEPDDTASDSDTLDLPSRRTFVKKPNLNSPPISRNRADDPARYTPAASGAAAADDTEDSDTVIVPSVSKPKRNMMIGGKRKPVVVLDDTEDDEVEPVKEVKKVVGRIGRIGKPKAESDRGGPPTISKPPPPPPPPPPVVRAPPEENEDERADRKRRELEKELEAKKKAPAKKKRKF